MKVAHSLPRSSSKELFLIGDPLRPFFHPVLHLIGEKSTKSGVTSTGSISTTVIAMENLIAVLESP